MNDEDVITRLRTALDEVTAAPSTAVDPPALVASQDHRAARWLAVAAAAVLVVGAVAAIGVNLRHRDATGGASTAASDTTQPVSEATQLATPATWVVLASQDLVPGDITVDHCCKSYPAPGPATVMAWGSVDGIEQGLLVLRSEPSLDGTPATPTFESNGFTAERMQELTSKVAPGSGVPYVLPDDGVTLLGSGIEGDGELVSQAYTNDRGTVTITVGDYRGQLAPLVTHGFHMVPIENFRTTGARTTLDTGEEYVVWRMSNGRWATMTVSPELTDRTDALIAALGASDTPAATEQTTAVPASVPAGTGTQISGWAGNPITPFAADLDSGYVATTVPTFTAGDVTIDAATNGARPTVFVFYAEWSPHSKPLVESVVRAYAAGQFPPATQLVMVRSADGGGRQLFNADDIAGWGYDGPIYFDIDKGDGSPGEVATAFGANGFPFLVVAGPDGGMQRRHSGELSADELVPFVSGARTEGGFHLTAPGTDFDEVVGYDQYGVEGWFVTTDAPDPITATPANIAVIAADPDRNSSVTNPNWSIGQQVVYSDTTSSRTFVVVGWKPGYDGPITGTQDGAVLIVSYLGTSDVPWVGYLAPA